jgi:hypothetical protein
MPLQLFQRTIDQAHRDELPAALGLPEHFDGDRFNRVSRTHGCQCRSAAAQSLSPACWQSLLRFDGSVRKSPQTAS